MNTSIEYMLQEGKTMTNDFTMRIVTGTSNKPQLYLTKELRQLGLKKGDTVVVMVRDNKIIIQRAKVVIE